MVYIVSAIATQKVLFQVTSTHTIIRWYAPTGIPWDQKKCHPAHSCQKTKPKPNPASSCFQYLWLLVVLVLSSLCTCNI